MSHSHIKQSFIATAGCVVLVGLLLVFVGWPVGMVIGAAWEAKGDTEPGLSLSTQRASLAYQTLALVILTLAIALPVGVVVALAVFRSDVPAKLFWALLILLPVLVPLDLHATAWLATLGPQGLARSIGLPIELKGLVGAAWVHAMASIPWVAAIVGAAVSIVEAELEEDSLLIVGPIRTMWHVTLRRSFGAITGAGLFVAVLTAGEMAVTDLLQVRTYAETIYTEFAVKYRVGAATATAVPGLAVWLVLIGAAGALIVRRVPQDAQALFARRPVFHLGRWRWLATAGCALLVAASLGVPTVSLVWRTGLKYPMRPPSMSEIVQSQIDRKPAVQELTVRSTGDRGAEASRPRWLLESLFENLLASWRSAREQVYLSLLVAGLTALCVVPVAWLLSLAARHAWAGRALASVVTCVLFALPGPVLGIGLKLALNRPTRWWGTDPHSVGGTVSRWLVAVNDSPGSLIWLHAMRTLPFAVVVLWPATRLMNRSLLEAAAIDGAGPLTRFWHVERPACLPAMVTAALVVAVLSIGEVAGSVIICPAGLQPLSVRIFTLAHNGVDNHLAGICLVLLGAAAAGSLAVLLSLRWTVRNMKE